MGRGLWQVRHSPVFLKYPVKEDENGTSRNEKHAGRIAAKTNFF